MAGCPLAVCDYGLTDGQKTELGRWPGLEVLPSDEPISHPWLGKALLGQFLKKSGVAWDILMWLDADALFTHALPEIPPLLQGYDLLLDAHVQSVGEIAHARHDLHLDPPVPQLVGLTGPGVAEDEIV